MDIATFAAALDLITADDAATGDIIISADARFGDDEAEARLTREARERGWDLAEDDCGDLILVELA